MILERASAMSAPAVVSAYASATVPGSLPAACHAASDAPHSVTLPVGVNSVLLPITVLPSPVQIGRA